MEGKPAAGAEHSGDLAVETPLVLDVHLDVLGPREVEALVVEGELQSACLTEGRAVGEPDTL